MELSQAKQMRYDAILKNSSINAEVANLSKEERVELKSHAIKKAVKLGKYTYNG